MKKLDLTKLPIGTKLWTPILGDCMIVRINENEEPYSVKIESEDKTRTEFLTTDGRYYCDAENDECIIFPSREKRAWEEYFKSRIPDKALVWCWDENDTHRRLLRFYDLVNDATFTYNGERNSDTQYDYMEAFEGEYPEWAIEAQKTLED